MTWIYIGNIIIYEHLLIRLRVITHTSETRHFGKHGVKMKNYIEKVKFLYKILAKVYDVMDILLFPAWKRNPRIGLAAHIPNEAMDVLEVCFGTGSTGIGLAAANCRNRIVGVDISEGMLKVAQNKIRRKQLANVELLCADAANISFNREFDAVITSLSLHEMPKEIMDSVLSGMAGVLKNSGKMYIIEWDRPDSFIGSSIFKIFPGMFEPKGFTSFLDMNWKDCLGKYCLDVEQIEKYTFTKLIIATKNIARESVNND